MSQSYPLNTNVHGIFASQAFQSLKKQQKLYAYHFTRASLEGALICLFQQNYQTPPLFVLLQLTFKGQPIELLKLQFIKQVDSEDQWNKLIVYVAAFFSQYGNIKSFGSTKFCPQAKPQSFRKLVQTSHNYRSQKDLMDYLLNEVIQNMYQSEGKHSKIGYPPSDQSGYYSSNLSKQQIDMVDQLLQILNISPINTHIYKIRDNHYTVKVASVNQSTATYQYKQSQINIEYGFFSQFLLSVVNHLKQCKPYVSSSHQTDFLKHYIESFITGSIQAHKESQKAWVSDKGPIVQTNIGFIETYHDPKQVRAYWEGFVAVVNKKQSLKVNELVNRAEQVLKCMPWPKQFEKDVFLKPDFTNLNVLTFASFATPRGINIPNYDDIRQNFGFKNVYLGNNILLPTAPILFLSQEDSDFMIKNIKDTFFHLVSFHQLMGHGCGKLLQQNSDGTFNFEKGLKNPLNGQQVKYFKVGETWTGKFQSLANPYQQCRADSVALYFSCSPLLTILQPQYKDNWSDISYCSFLNFVKMGVAALQFFRQDKWMQAHMNGRFVILMVLLQAGKGFVSVKVVKQGEGQTLEIRVDREQVLTTGQQAMKNFLLKMNIYKAMGDVDDARKMFEDYSRVDEYWMDIRRVVLLKTKPRSLQTKGFMSCKGVEVQYNVVQQQGVGIINQFLHNYPSHQYKVLQVWQQIKHYMKP